jgi:hypothetical protein
MVFNLNNIHEEIPIDTPKETVTKKSSVNLLKSVLAKNWCVSPVSGNHCPKAAAAVFAAFVHCKVFESEPHTTEIFNEIIKKACPTVPIKLTKVETNPVRYW